MIKTKEDFLSLAPADSVYIVTNDQVIPETMAMDDVIHFLTIQLEGEKESCILVLTGDDSVKAFRANGLLQEKLYYKKIKLQNLFALSMSNKLAMIVDPFDDSTGQVVKITPREVCDYTGDHMAEMFSGDLHNLNYMNFRIAQAKAQKGDCMIRLLKDLILLDSFYVASFSVNPISPFVTTVSNVDIRPHVMLFTDRNLAMHFCNHVNEKNPLRKVVPIQIRVFQIIQMMKQNRDVNVNMFFLNDGGQTMAFSYSDLLKAIG